MKSSLAALCLGTLVATPFSALRAEVLVDTVLDFSMVAQGVNGLEYGYYTVAEANSFTNEIFSTLGMVPSSEGWDGTQPFETPEINAGNQHPGVGNLYPAVRRYTVGSAGEPSYSGLVRIMGSFGGPIAFGGGFIAGFITIDGVNAFEQTTDAASGAVFFDFTVPVVDGTRIDFGVRAVADTSGDRTHFAATVTAIPEASAQAALFGAFAGAWVLGARRRRRAV